MSITPERVIALAEQQLFGLGDPGLCLRCGEERGGCEPDARFYQCPSCNAHEVFGATEIVLMMV